MLCRPVQLCKTLSFARGYRLQDVVVWKRLSFERGCRREIRRKDAVLVFREQVKFRWPELAECVKTGDLAPRNNPALRINKESTKKTTLCERRWHHPTNVKGGKNYVITRTYRRSFSNITTYIYVVFSIRANNRRSFIYSWQFSGL